MCGSGLEDTGAMTTWRRHLRETRTQAGWSLRQLGAELGVSFSTLARLERGEGQPTAHTRWVVEAWLSPKAPPTPCPCGRCRPTKTEQRLASLEARLAALETTNKKGDDG